jgi:hypothetical protein
MWTLCERNTGERTEGNKGIKESKKKGDGLR